MTTLKHLKCLKYLKHILIRLRNLRTASSHSQAVKLPPQNISFVCSSVAELSGEPHQVDSVPGTKVKS